MNTSMAHIAAAALEQGPHTPSDTASTAHRHPLDLRVGPVAVDVWTDGRLGFVLLLHRRDDGFAASEIYYSLKGEDQRWMLPEHLSGEIVGFDPEDPSVMAEILSGAALTVLSESDSRVFTGTGEDDDELVRVYELLVSERVDRIRIENRSRTDPQERAAPPMAVVVVRPGEPLRVSPVLRDGVESAPTDGSLTLFPAKE
ncbi:hypothetical protein AB0D57_20175 [Streptomyces sp. NPDC048275]|uniref:hypothetical protein n=1 Tax=Streptomyces sp. NPDC048275 TaxID=3155629 RepID=UPI00340772A2